MAVSEALTSTCSTATIVLVTRVQRLTSTAVVSKSLKEVKGRRGPVRHREEPAQAAGRRRVDASHLGVQERLQVTALPPQQGGNIPEGGTITCELPTDNQPPHLTSTVTLL